MNSAPGYGINASADSGTQATVGSRPTYKNTATGAMNFNPTLNFDGGDHFSMLDNYGIVGTSGFITFAVTRRNSVGTYAPYGSNAAGGLSYFHHYLTTSTQSLDDSANTKF